MIAIAAAHASDLATFAIAALIGIPVARQEANPTMVAAYLFAGLAGVAAWKLLLVGTIAGLVRRVRTRSRRPAVLIAYAAGLVGAASNLVAIAVALGVR